MAMTMTQKILAAHAGLKSVRAGQLIMAKLDMVLGNDINDLSDAEIKIFILFSSAILIILSILSKYLLNK